MGFVHEFKEFAVKGNAVDLAVGVIIGAAFGKIVDSIIKDLVMPVTGLVVGGLDFSDLFVALAKIPDGTSHSLAAVREAGVPVFAYGAFVTVLINFLILAWIIFLMIKGMNALRRARPAAEAAPPAPPEEVVLLREIRDAVRAR